MYHGDDGGKEDIVLEMAADKSEVAPVATGDNVEGELIAARDTFKVTPIAPRDNAQVEHVAIPADVAAVLTALFSLAKKEAEPEHTKVWLLRSTYYYQIM